jgi:3-oxoacyl-[acyl-carrier-protein] synthase II
MAERRVVITGLGTVNPVGIGWQDSWKALTAGQSGVANVTLFDAEAAGIDTKFAAEVKNFNIQDFYPDKRKAGGFIKEMDRISLFAMAAAKLAMDDAKFDMSKTRPERVSTFIGTGVGGFMTTTADQTKFLESGPKKIGLRSIIKLMPNAPSGQIGIEFGAKGRAKADSTACASGLDSLLDAFMYIKANRADAIIAGGCESTISPLAMASFGNMGALSTRNDAPQKASRPFSKDRDGFVMGEGAAVLILEELEHARSRQAHIYAEVVGGGAACDAYHIVAPHESGAGAAQAIKEALADGGIEPEEVGYINAHGTSTPLNDERETMAIKSVFGAHAHKIAVSSTKSMIGHLLGAAGAVGTLVAALSLDKQLVHPTINYEIPDPACDLDYVPNVAREAKINYALVQALGFGGHNTVLALKRYSE